MAHGARTRVLHVVECWEAGVRSAVEQYISLSASWAHHSVMASTRFDAPVEAHADVLEIIGINHSGRLFVPTSGRVLWERSGDFDVVHAHSSYAGLVVASLAGRLKRSVWTPHTLPYLRTNLRPIARAMYVEISRFIARRFDVLAAASPHEDHELEQLLPANQQSNRVLLSYAPQLGRQLNGREFADRPFVVGVGRLTESKGIPRFLQLAEMLGDRVDFVWIGDGDRELRGDLESRGVLVTGWVSKADVREWMARSLAFVCTSRWETGFNIATLDAMSLGLPVRLIQLPQYEYEPDSKFVSPDVTDLATWLTRVINDQQFRSIESMNSMQFARHRCTSNLGRSLMYAYRG